MFDIDTINNKLTKKKNDIIKNMNGSPTFDNYIKLILNRSFSMGQWTVALLPRPHLLPLPLLPPQHHLQLHFHLLVHLPLLHITQLDIPQLQPLRLLEVVFTRCDRVAPGLGTTNLLLRSSSSSSDRFRLFSCCN
jgi:hypothetical protein